MVRLFLPSATTNVYANSNDAYYGDNVLQPGTYDGGSEQNDVRFRADRVLASDERKERGQINFHK